MSKRQISSDGNNRKFKSLGGGSGANSSGMSTLMIVGIVVGCLVGVLIIFLILRFFVFKKKKNNNGGDQTTNSGLAKLNMSHDGVVNAKRTIMEPAKLLNPNRNSYPSHNDPPSYSDENMSRSPSPSTHSPSDEGIHVNEDEEKRFRNRTHRNSRSRNSLEVHRERGKRNAAYQHQEEEGHAGGDEDVRNHPNNHQRTYPERDTSLSPNRKVPYRYNSGKGPRGREDREAIEALNKEQFCGEGSRYISPQNRRGGPARGRSQSVVQRSSERGFANTRHVDTKGPATGRRPVGKQISEPTVYPLRNAERNPRTFSDFSEAPSAGKRSEGRKKSYTADRVTGQRNFMLPRANGQSREESNGLHRDLQNSRGFSGRKRSNGWNGTLDARTQSKHKKAEAIPEELTQKPGTRRASKSRKRKEEVKTEMRLIDNRDLNDPNKKGGSGRFAPVPPSPTLPRHVVPSSRK